MKSSSRGRKQRGRRGAFLALPALAAAGAVLTLAACSPSAASPASSPTEGGSPSPSTGAAPAASGTALSVRNTSLGTILTDGRGFTLYAFEADQGTTSACSGACAAAWPPAAATSSSPQVGTGVTPSLVGQAMRADGTAQLTYAGHPVYLFVHDTAPGSTSGQGLQAFGARWDVLTPTGQEVTSGTSTSTPAPSTTSAPSPTCTIPQNNGGDHDADNNGGPDDGDGCDK
jgi:predicted lipoprotein with Yx(FWY)xxD motif